MVVKAGSESTAKLRLVSAVFDEGHGVWGGGLAVATAGVWARIMMEESICVPGKTGLFGIYCTPQSKSRAGGGAESVERPAGVLAARDILGGVGGVKLQQSMHRALENTDRFTGD